MFNSLHRDDAFKIFLVEYSHNGSAWILELPASDHDDAQARVNSLSGAQLLGERAGTIPANDRDCAPTLRLLADWSD
jgi:hypothetical protein